jgi:hypothetical protein
MLNHQTSAFECWGDPGDTARASTMSSTTSRGHPRPPAALLQVSTFSNMQINTCKFTQHRILCDWKTPETTEMIKLEISMKFHRTVSTIEMKKAKPKEHQWCCPFCDSEENKKHTCKCTQAYKCLHLTTQKEKKLSELTSGHICHSVLCTQGKALPTGLLLAVQGCTMPKLYVSRD